MHKLLAILLLLVLSIPCAFAQQQRCNERDLRRCSDLAKLHKYERAIKLLQRSLVRNPACVESYIRLSDYYYRTGNVLLSIGCANQAISINAQEGVGATMFMVKQMCYFNQDSAALQLLATTSKNSALNSQQKKFLQNEYMQLYNTLSLVNAAPVSEIFNLGDSINTAQHQYYPTISADESVLLFTGIEHDLNEDFLISKYDSCLGWRKAINIGYPPNTGDPDGSACLSIDGRYLFFTRCNTFSDRGYDGGGCDLVFTYNNNEEEWSSPQIFGATVNSADYEGQPSITSDNKTIYFVSDRKGGYGGKDIYRCDFVDGYWQPPYNLGATINTSGDELSPFIHADGKHLYFASNGHPGAGKLDLFVSELVSDTVWQKPVNLGFPISSPANENSICVNASGHTAYFASDRSGGAGKYDIYTAALPVKVQAENTVVVQGRLIEKYQREAIKEHRLYAYNPKDSLKTMRWFLSNAGDGSFSFSVPAKDEIIIGAEDLQAYRPLRYHLSAQNAKHNVLIKNLKFKVIGLTDTIYKSYFSGNDYADTSLGYLGQHYHTWLSEPSDSIMLYINAEYNVYEDTSLLNTLCFSEQGRLHYLQYIDSIKLAKEKQLQKHLQFYLDYLEGQGVPRHKMRLQPKVVAINNKHLLQIEITAVEYY